MKPQIAVIGIAGAEEYPKGKGPTKKQLHLAREMGKQIAKQGWVLLTGGKGGIMEAASQGSTEKGGITVGFIKGAKRNQANKHTAVEVVTGFEVSGSEFILVHSADALVVIGGGAGTVQEIAMAYRTGKPILVLSFPSSMKNIKHLDRRKTTTIEKVKTPTEAITRIKKILTKKYW